MIEGTIESSGDAVVRLKVRGRTDGPVRIISAVVDTGFNGYLVAPRSLIEELSLTFLEEARYTLGDGSEVVSRTYFGQIEWNGNWRRIIISQMEGDILLGMAAMHGSRLMIDVTEGGSVAITPLSDL